MTLAEIIINRQEDKEAHGARRCIYCGAHWEFDRVDDHDDDCLYILAGGKFRVAAVGVNSETEEPQ
jgi:hypothetical protein